MCWVLWIGGLQVLNDFLDMFRGRNCHSSIKTPCSHNEITLWRREVKETCFVFIYNLRCLRTYNSSWVGGARLCPDKIKTPLVFRFENRCVVFGEKWEFIQFLSSDWSVLTVDGFDYFDVFDWMMVIVAFDDDGVWDFKDTKELEWHPYVVVHWCFGDGQRHQNSNQFESMFPGHFRPPNFKNKKTWTN